ncbi:MAG TPA: GerMN domain-containing protein [Desulfosporosinus sp.]|nr:GerMN domain-containing protein [Desulfosporosinus sp.]
MSKHRCIKLFITTMTILLVGVFMTGCGSAKTSTNAPSDAAPKVSEDTPTDSVAPTTNDPGTPGTPGTPDTPAPADSVTPSDSTQESLKLTLYFPNGDASGLIATERSVVVKNKEVISAMFSELQTPPSGIENPIPKGTTLLSAAVSADGVATLDLSSEFQKNFGGGSAGEQMTMYSIVNTLTTLKNVTSVQFLLNGVKGDGMLGNLETSRPLRPNESLNIKK